MTNTKTHSTGETASPVSAGAPGYSATVDRFLAEVDARGLEVAEEQADQVLADYKRHGLCGLLVPRELGGGEWSAAQMADLILRLGSMAPSGAVGAVMHNFSVAGLVAAWRYGNSDLAGILGAVASPGMFVSSGFAELGSGGALTRPTMTARPQGEQWILNGVKRPCSLSRSMDLLTASVWLEDDSGEPGYAVAIIEATTPGLSVEKLWGNHVLAGAESDAVVLTDVHVNRDQVLRPESDPGSESAVLQTVGMNWFLTLVLSAYVGMATRLVRELSPQQEPVVAGPLSIGRLASAVRGCEVLVRAMAGELDRGGLDPDALQSRILDARAAVESVFKVLAAEATDHMRGTQFIHTGTVSRLRESLSGLTFHPPARDERYATSTGGRS